MRPVAIERIDKGTIKKNLIPLILCICVSVIAFLAVFSRMNTWEKSLALAILIAVQLTASLNDIYNRKIPFKLTAFALFTGVLVCIITYPLHEAVSYVLSGLAAFVIMKLLVFISKNQIGGGDMAIMTVTGLYRGLYSFFAILVISVMLAGIYSLALILANKGDKKTEIPFAPFILIATTIMLTI